MDLDWQTIAQITATAVTAGTALAGFLTGPGALRSRLKGDVELLERLPPDSNAHVRMLKHIDHQVEVIETLDKNASRDISGAVIATLLAVGLGWFAFFLIDLDSSPWGLPIWEWVWPAAGVFVLVFAAACLSNMFDSLQRIPRDAKGKLV